MFKRTYHFTVKTNESISNVFGIEGLVECLTDIRQIHDVGDDKILFTVKSRKKNWLRIKHELIKRCKSMQLRKTSMNEEKAA